MWGGIRVTGPIAHSAVEGLSLNSAKVGLYQSENGMLCPWP